MRNHSPTPSVDSAAAVRTARNYFLGFLGLVLCYRIGVLLFLDVPLFYDEAYYFGWAEDLAFGYFSKPPLVAWSIALTTAISESSWAVRLASPLYYSVAAIFVWRTSLLWFDARSAAWAAAVFLSLPLVGFNSMFITTDAPLLCFWCAALWALSHALQTDRLSYWLLVGVCSGLGLMSKYSMAILLPSAALLLLWVPEYRYLFRRPGPYLGVLVAALIFLPNVLWNAANDFLSLKHTAEISQLDRSSLNIAGLLEFVAAQLICLGPWFLWWLRPGTQKPGWHLERGYKFALMMSVCFFIVISTQALLSRANANWAAPGFAGIAMFLGVAMSQARLLQNLAGLVLNLTLILTLQFYHPLLAALDIERTSQNDPYKRVSGWREAVWALQPIVKAEPQRLVVSNSRLLLANMHYYSETPRPQIRAWNSNQLIDNHYELVADLGGQSGADVFFLARNPLGEEVLERFDNSVQLAPIQVPVYADLTRQLYIYRLDGFKGYR